VGSAEFIEVRFSLRENRAHGLSTGYSNYGTGIARRSDEMGLWRGLAAAGAVCGLCGIAAARVEAQRLPGGVTPEHYALTVTPDLAKARFAGSETIEVVLDKPASAITLNAAEIEFGAVRAEVGMAPGGQRQPQERMRGFLAPLRMTTHQVMGRRPRW
jgi:hypothetical protein